MKSKPGEKLTHQRIHELSECLFLAELRHLNGWKIFSNEN